MATADRVSRSRTSPFLTLPQLDLGLQGDSTREPPQPSPSIPDAAPSVPSPSPHRDAHKRFLSPDEWARVAHAIGAIEDLEHQAPIHPTSWCFPPKGLPSGLYRDVVSQRTKYRVLFHSISICRGTMMIVQVILGAVLTALGTVKLDDGTAITIIAVVQTVIAGILALIHNSGLPDRYRSNRFEFAYVEGHMRELLDTRIVEYDQDLDEIIVDLYDRFERVNTAVQANQPASYVSSNSIVRGQSTPNSMPHIRKCEREGFAFRQGSQSRDINKLSQD
ncbi:uncharacterized protein E0L32_007272 [Thyridium curvatum]|uniref:SMODS and SLOG-associating 2TM effector domain-containing protein n=1 Tax=Thyridium curvatum TaxID=1093900 RepID=A0A507B3R5_9PEZI|nr:uncharacterized protein E0L32_007272 [Thyridium curvatum]TPX11969.1 hypothetical protein E0L32_007272 [Thyridium curvatum]